MSFNSDSIPTLFQEYCNKYSKLFLPSSNDEAVSNNLHQFYKNNFSLDILQESIELYVKQSSQPVLIYDFALASNNIREQVVKDHQRKDDLQSLLNQTKERMQALYPKDE